MHVSVEYKYKQYSIRFTYVQHVYPILNNVNYGDAYLSVKMNILPFFQFSLVN